MQNEITELRNQVRTLKRIVCLVCCLFGVLMFAGCASSNHHMMVDEDFVPTSFNAVVIKNPDSRIIAEQVGWIELELAEVFKGLGYKIIGENEVVDYPNNSVLAVRYNGTVNYFQLGSSAAFCRLRIVVENATIDKTVCTVEAKYQAVNMYPFESKDAEVEAMKILVNRIREAFSQN